MSSALANLSLSDPRCNNDSCLAFQTAHNLSQATISYYYQYEYGHFTAYYIVVAIGIASIISIYNQWHSRRVLATRPSTGQRHVGWRNRLQACRRSIAYRHLRFPYEDAIRPPPLGMLASLLLFLLFLAVLAFGVRPYYREHRGYGSPPLAVRTGLIAAALTPLLVALGGKFNVVTLLTGVSYERLNVIHRWVGWFCLGVSIVHAIPFIVAPLRDGGYEALRTQYYEPGGFEVCSAPVLLESPMECNSDAAYICATVYWYPSAGDTLWIGFPLLAMDSTPRVRILLLRSLLHGCHVFGPLLLALWSRR